MNHPIIIIAVFLYIYGPVILSINRFFDISFFTSIGFIIYSLINKRTIFPLYIIIFIPILILFIYSGLLVTLTDEYTLSILLRLILKPFRIIIVIMGGVALAYIIYYRNIFTYSNDTLYYIFISIALHGAIMIIQLINPEFKDWIYGFTTTGQFRSTFDYNFRMGGLTQSSGGAILSVVQSVGVLLTPYIWKIANKKNKIQLLLGNVIIISSVLICGRSGLWAIIIGIPLILIWQNEFSFYKTIVKIPLLISIFGGILYFILFFYSGIQEESNIYYSLGRTLDEFIEYKEGGDFTSPTVNELKTHIIFPTDFKTFIMGDGEHLLGKSFDRELQSDIGFIKNIWGFGIIGSIIYWLPLLIFAISITNNKIIVPIYAPLIMAIILMYVFHFKENLLYVRMFISIIALMAGIYYIDHTSRINIIRYNNTL